MIGGQRDFRFPKKTCNYKPDAFSRDGGSNCPRNSGRNIGAHDPTVYHSGLQMGGYEDSCHGKT